LVEGGFKKKREKRTRRKILKKQGRGRFKKGESKI